MEQGVDRPQTYLERFEFFVAPHDLTEQNANPTLHPHVMNNSWACLEGCAPTTLPSSRAEDASRRIGAATHRAPYQAAMPMIRRRTP